MAKVNQFIIANIPSAKDLYEKMGFRYHQKEVSTISY